MLPGVANLWVKSQEKIKSGLALDKEMNLRKFTLPVIVLVSLTLFACSALPKVTQVAATQSPATASAQAPLPVAVSDYPAISGEWTIDETRPLQTKYIFPLTEYQQDYAFQIGKTGQKLEFSGDLVVYDAMAYEYHWVDASRIRIAVSQPGQGTVWFVYGVKLKDGKLALLDVRDENELVSLSRP